MGSPHKSASPGEGNAAPREALTLGVKLGVDVRVGDAVSVGDFELDEEEDEEDDEEEDEEEDEEGELDRDRAAKNPMGAKFCTPGSITTNSGGIITCSKLSRTNTGLTGTGISGRSIIQFNIFEKNGNVLWW